MLLMLLVKLPENCFLKSVWHKTKHLQQIFKYKKRVMLQSSFHVRFRQTKTLRDYLLLQLKYLFTSQTHQLI